MKNKWALLFVHLFLWIYFFPSILYFGGGDFLLIIFLVFLILLFTVPFVSLIKPKLCFTISARSILSLLLVSALLAFVVSHVIRWMPNFEAPVSEDQARLMATQWLKKSGINASPGYAFMRKGDDAGDIGYYVFGIKDSENFIIIPADARFGAGSIYYGRNGLSYIDYYLRYSVRSDFISFSNTPLLKLKSLKNKLLFRKSREQLEWSELLNNKEAYQ